MLEELNNNYKITDIQKQKNNPKRYSIFLDDSFAFGIDEIDLLYYKLEINKTLSKKDYDFIINNLVLTKAKNKALKYLSYRMRAKSQVVEKLREQEEFSEDIIEKVIVFLEKYNYVNDEIFCKAYINDKMNIKGYGSYKISYDLKSLKIDDDLIDQFLYNSDLVDEQEQLKILLQKKLQKNKYFNSTNIYNNSDTYYKEKQKLFNFFARKGFSYDNINNAFVELIEEFRE
ncbi:MAG: RecX family transcriptional regulator [bacterium]